MATRRVWLHEWEWACCGASFAVGDHVALMVDRVDGNDEWLAQHLGTALSRTVDDVESHHEDGGAEARCGTVAAMSGVALSYEERRVPRRGRVPEGPRELIGQEWIARMPAPLPYVVESTPMPDSATLHDVPRVPWPPRDSEEVAAEEPLRLAGYLVDVELAE